MELYAFDILPVHPVPQPLESYTSYLTRLAEGNGLTRYTDLTARLFPSLSSLQVRDLTDYTPTSFGYVAENTMCSEGHLRATTFFHLARKFGRMPQARSLSLLMAQALAPHLRYCPQCIAERGCYLLPWRLRMVDGCPQHGCTLLDGCPACGSTIRLLVAPFRVGICPHCQFDLRLSHASQLSETQWQCVQQRWQDIEFLLLPQSWEELSTVNAVLGAGYVLERKRRRTGQTANQVAAQTGILSAGIRAMERGNIGTSGATLLRYIHYAEYLSVSLQSVFLEGIAQYAALPETLSYPEKLHARLLHAVAHLRATGQPIDDTALRIWTGVCRQTLQRHPSTSVVLHRLEEEAFDNRERILLKQIETAIQELQAQGKPVYRKDIYQLVGLNASVLKAYPRIRERLKSLNNPLPSRKATRFRRCEQRLLAQAQQICQQLLEQGQPITQEKIAAGLGLSVTHLFRAYPQVSKWLGQTRTIQATQTERQLLAQVETAIQSLRLKRQSVTRKTVACLLDISVGTFYRYPLVRQRLREVCDEELAAYRRQRAHQVRHALDWLQIRSQPLTQTTICRQAGLNENAVRQHPDLKPLVFPALEAQRTRHIHQLLERVTTVLATLEERGQKVSLPAVSRLVGLSLSCLRDYPEVVACVSQARLDRRLAYEAHLVARINEAIQHLNMTQQPLTQQSICSVIGLSPNTLRHYRQAKATVDAVASAYHRLQHTAWHERYRRTD